MKRKITALCLIVAMLAVAVVGGTMAYFTDTDEAVNVMTMGNVKIEQIESEWNAAKSGLQEFTQGKELLPYVGELGWENTTDANGALRRFTMKNVMDKIVQVKNTGRSDAYVRTIFAFEMGDYKTVADFYYNVIGISNNAQDGNEYKFPGTWVWTDKTDAMITKIDGQNYLLMVATHQNPIKAGETTIPSLLQVYLNKTATNETVEKLDGNGNGTYDILTFTQAVQAKGFDTADAAFAASFDADDNGVAGAKPISATNHPWINAKSATTFGITEAGTYDMTGDVIAYDSAYFHTHEATGEVTVNGNDAVVYGSASSIDAFQWEGGTIPAMSNMFSSANGSKVTVNNLTFTGTMSSVMAGHYVNANYNNFNTEFNNVKIVDAEVVSFSANTAPALTIYGTAVLNNCEVTGTTLSALDTDPMWPVYDVAAVNYSDTTLNNTKVGTVHVWNQAKLTVAEESEVDTIIIRGNMNTTKYGLTIKAGASVDAIDLSAITDKTRINITIEDGATVGGFVANGNTYASIADWQNAAP